MLIPILITGGILGALVLSARQPAPAPGRISERLPDPQAPPDVPPGMPGMTVEGRTIRIDPDFPSDTIQARVGDTISMHGISRRSEDNPEGYVLTAPNPGGQPVMNPSWLVRQTGPNHFLLLSSGQLTISWAPNYRVAVDVR